MVGAIVIILSGGACNIEDIDAVDQRATCLTFSHSDKQPLGTGMEDFLGLDRGGYHRHSQLWRGKRWKSKAFPASDYFFEP